VTFTPMSPHSQIEFNIDPSGLHIVANERGWQDLARWCLRMADPATPAQSSAPCSHSGVELDPDLVDEHAVAEGRLITAFWGLGDVANLEELRDVFLHKTSGAVGPDFWIGSRVRSGSSPGTQLWSRDIMNLLSPLEGTELESLSAEMGRVIASDATTAWLEPGPGLLGCVDSISRTLLSDLLVELDLDDTRVEGYGWATRLEYEEWLASQA